MPDLWRTSWRRRAAQLVHTAVQAILPPACVSCGQAGALLCDDCRQALPQVEGPLCTFCGTPLSSGDCQCRVLPLTLQQLRASFWFTGTLAPAIHHFKYGNVFALAPILGGLMVDFWQRHPLPADLLIPIPLYPQRERERGYNQAVLLAREVSARIAAPLDETALRRIRSTRPQVGLSARERQNNVRGAFAAQADAVAGKQVLLLDDVFTTGATVAAAASALLAAGATGVRAFCLARAVRA